MNGLHVYRFMGSEIFHAGIQLRDAIIKSFVTDRLLTMDSTDFVVCGCVRRWTLDAWAARGRSRMSYEFEDKAGGVMWNGQVDF